MLMAGVAIGWGRRPLLVAGLAVGIPTLALRGLGIWAPDRFSPLWNEAWTVPAVIGCILARVFREGPINFVCVQGAVAAYHLLGVAYAHAYQISEYLSRSSVTSTEGPLTSVADCLYYSFSTLGYGDIIPTDRVSRWLGIDEAITANPSWRS